MKPFRIGTRRVVVYAIPIRVAANEEDWEFVFVNAGNGKLQMAVF